MNNPNAVKPKLSLLKTTAASPTDDSANTPRKWSVTGDPPDGYREDGVPIGQKRTPRPFVPREFKLPDGRRATLIPASVGAVIEAKDNGQTIILPKAGKGGFPVTAAYEEVCAWWRGQ
jgi:hypothetical protein